MHALQTKKTKIKIAAVKQQTIHPTIQTLQTKKNQHAQVPINQKTTKRTSTASITHKPETK